MKRKHDTSAPHWESLVNALQDDGFGNLILAPSYTDQWAVQFIMEGMYE